MSAKPLFNSAPKAVHAQCASVCGQWVSVSVCLGEMYIGAVDICAWPYPLSCHASFCLSHFYLCIVCVSSFCFARCVYAWVCVCRDCLCVSIEGGGGGDTYIYNIVSGDFPWGFPYPLTPAEDGCLTPLFPPSPPSVFGLRMDEVISNLKTLATQLFVTARTPK